MLGQTVELLSQLLWGRGTIALTLLCGLYFTAGTGFLPLTRLPTVLKRTVGSLFQKRDRKSGGVSPFAAVSTALDAKTEFEVIQAIKDRGITCIIIAHRLSTIRDCDEIIVMDRGEVVERGTHEELYAAGRLYTQLVSTE